MPRLLIPLSLILALLLPTLTHAQDLTGTYTVEGSNPDAKGAYRGEVRVARAGDVFHVIWIFGKQQHAGTGILRDDQFAVVYQPKGGQPGIAFYKVNADGSLSGTWTTLGGRTLGTETWKPKDRM